MILVEVRGLLDAVARALSTKDEGGEQSLAFLQAARVLCLYATSQDGTLHEREESCLDTLFWTLPSGECQGDVDCGLISPDSVETAFGILEHEIANLAAADVQNTGTYIALTDSVVGAITSACQIVLSADDDFHVRELKSLSYITSKLRNCAVSTERQMTCAPRRQPALSGNVNYIDAPSEDPDAVRRTNLQENLAKLHALVGLAEVKEQVETLANVAKIFEMRQSRGLSVPDMSFHLVFLGNPGTGKTTVARIIAEIYAALGLLKTGTFKEVDRSGLVANYVGQTATKTLEVLIAAVDGVLFIDEAYALTNSGTNDFGNEAIETLLKFMEDNRSRIVVIAAGYFNVMQEFLNSNPGLRSRFTTNIFFPDYSASELAEIFGRMAQSAGYVLEPSADVVVTDRLRTMWEAKTKDFANARDVRNFFEGALREQANRLSDLSNPTSEELCIITAQDVTRASQPDALATDTPKTSAYADFLLPGVPADCVIAALSAAGGNEIASGKLASPESSAALAVNVFGWFIERPTDLPPFPPLVDLDWPALRVDVERQMRFPWRGGRHPWLDAGVETSAHLIGVESKRFEPFRDAKTVSLSKTYDRDVWGNEMGPFASTRDALRSGKMTFAHIDAAQLVKHAFGLVTEGHRIGKKPVLLYLYAEPLMRGSTMITPEAHAKHRTEINTFSAAVAGAAVRFAACSYREWIDSWTGEARSYGDVLVQMFRP